MLARLPCLRTLTRLQAMLEQALVEPEWHHGMPSESRDTTAGSRPDGKARISVYCSTRLQGLLRRRGAHVRAVALIARCCMQEWTRQGEC
ncbi:hypothetical protein NDU88_003397 [Pleurodeles waltl]|uniref:Uncharacterized protein n=1 Tax=Pleurodeles waltl TaxID=8319 RepID=A0AAV7V299_PLEWA|nr:hypothetical protein NDU88_003397 [Pleurodeles waltl]